MVLREPGPAESRPLVPVERALHVERARRRYREWYLEREIPVFDTLESAVRTLGKIIRYNEFVAGRTNTGSEVG